ncbi:MAG: hypothetical protein AB7R89_11560 [Dehalococcoidia bacterium]
MNELLAQEADALFARIDADQTWDHRYRAALHDRARRLWTEGVILDLNVLLVR